MRFYSTVKFLCTLEVKKMFNVELYYLLFTILLHRGYGKLISQPILYTVN